MRITPASFYRNLFYLLGGFLAVYTVYSIVGYDDASTRDHSTAHRRQKHLFLTVSKDRIADRFDTLAPKRILDWTGIFGTHLEPGMMKECRGLEDRCIIITDRSQVNKADVVFFHGPNVKESDLPDAENRNESQIYVYASMETPKNTWINSPRFSTKMKDYFNWTQTFLHSSDSLWKYGSFWMESKEAEARGYKIESFHLSSSKMKKSKSGIFGLISNCVPERDNFLKALGRYMNVTIGGKCPSAPGLEDVCPRNKDCAPMYEDYPFYVAMENSICKDYVTEKYWDRVRYASISIVWSRKIMESTNPPPKSFIAVDDYKTVKEMADDLKRIEGDPKAYAEFFNWRFNQLWTYVPWNTKGFRNGICRLCEKLWDGPHEAKSYENINDWFEKEANCDRGDFFRQYS